ncbi:hypothetical protein C8F01DRAFT_989009, partial [Mycena amicta]
QCVTSIRSSGQRRESWLELIEEGNEEGWFRKNPTADPLLLRVVMLLKDVDTRWSATYLMIDRLLELMLAVQQYVDKYGLAAGNFTEKQLQVLSDVRAVLSAAHFIQEIVSAEHTPTLSVVIPLYEMFRQLLTRDLKNTFPKLSHALDAAGRKLDGYLDKARASKIYGLAMGMLMLYCETFSQRLLALNPTIKFEKNGGIGVVSL